ncbi:uncharacterized protein N7515_001183 [Penicillium bovifimosum]|uniref:PNPLA domain-containing protein n=1 Tax=Penicillium bovifimosum TaxID=126998 RepID=A0A9W9LAJ0_9EURO|nr:uncharacterized protein N7515_001183 [Penicillium bovifimosum]KAJ5146619.1 hypothetical protein N7515_001183 [Penicillium bovifimosum]
MTNLSGIWYLRSPISTAAVVPTDMNLHVISQIVLPWTQVLCLFVDSVSEMRELQRLLDRPPHKIQVGSRSVAVRFKVLVVLTAPQDYGPHELAAAVPQDQSRDVVAPEITFVDLRDRHELSPMAAFEPLRRVILDKLQSVQVEQRQHGLLFSAIHLCALWKSNLESQMRGLDTTAFDCLRVARKNYPSTLNRKACLVEFLRQTEKTGCEAQDISSFVASAILIDAYPPGMHSCMSRAFLSYWLTVSVFNPSHVFDELYRSDCTDGWGTQNRVDMSPSEFCDGVLARFTDFFKSIDPMTPPVAVRRRMLRRFHRRWGGLYSSTSCFFCLNRAPEHMLACRHAMCDNCVVIFGSKSSAGEHALEVTQCPMCGTEVHLAVRQLPPTKGPNILSLDGGGIRGIEQLGLLQSLEKRLGGDLLTGVFDLCVGTSVGALNIMDLVFNHSSADSSFRRFPDLARKIFQQPAKPVQALKCLAWITGLKRLLLDGKYDDHLLEETLKAALGPHRRIFDVGTTCGTDSRVAIIASRISDGKACLLANYRGIGRHAGMSAYEFLMPQSQDQNPLLWEVFFRTKSLPGFGPLQDGGVRANNPLSIALKESTLIWPGRNRPDLLVSVGTGYTAPERQFRHTRPGGILQDGAVARLIRATVSSPSMDGEQAFLEAQNYVSSHMRADIYRVNKLFHGPLPWLDDVEKLAELAESTFCVPDELVRAILVTGTLFFELDGCPTMRQGTIFCEGSILCTSTQPRKLIGRILAEIPGAEFQIDHQGPLGLVGEDNGCQDCGYYRKKVSFAVNSLDEPFTIQISNAGSQTRLGGFPKSVQKLLDEQQMQSSFGRPDHRTDAWPPARRCFCRRGTKRRVTFVEPSLGEKRRRL